MSDTIERFGRQSKAFLRSNLLFLGEKLLSNPSRVDDTLRHIVKIEYDQLIDNSFRELVAAGGVPIAYYNHQGHVDGMAVAAVSEHFINLTASLEEDYRLLGFLAILAKSMVTGHQGAELTHVYDLFEKGAIRLGAYPAPVTREEDRKYGISRKDIVRELRPLREKLIQRYGLMFSPEGTVQGGRHSIGEKRGNIHGMREPQNTNLVDLFRLAKKELEPMGRWPFYQPLAFHGSFEIMESLEGDEEGPKLTFSGALSLLAAALGIPLGLRIQAKLLAPFEEGKIEADLGINWMDDGVSFNDYAMRKLKAGLPPIAWGVYS